MRNMNKGKFIVIEGLDGTGKTTHSKIICDKLSALGRKVKVQSEPTCHEFGKMCREALSGKRKCEKSQLALLFTLDRIDHNKNKEDGIEKLIDEGVDVISDRYYYSTFAYQGIDVGVDWLEKINLECSDIRKPDLCIFLDLKPEISMNRINAARDASQIEIYENLEYLTKIRQRFYDVFGNLKNENIVTVCADDTIENVNEKIFSEIKKIIF